MSGDLGNDSGAALQTERLMLREFHADDADALERVIGDPKTMIWYPYPFSRAQVDEWIVRNQRRYSNGETGLWAMVLKKTGEMIGDCGLVWKEVEGERLIEVAYHVRRDHWGNGYAPEAARACIGFAFKERELDRVISLIRPENTQSRRVAEKNGLRIVKQTVYWDLAHDVWMLTRDEWNNAKT
jgi:ribosomal-protein-alanine N-acetyltransferase